MSEIVSLIMSAGRWSRLWLLSRKCLRKQFPKFVGAQSPFEATTTRFSLIEFANEFVKKLNNHRVLIKKQEHDCEYA